ncbi:hypothetical protein [Pseudomonas sp. p21]|uniref:hypothetical protein n=1 Tax=Pseudomonas sp. p21 TaxID=1825979 RepID=UPI0007C65685|nr:hypothetical protein [Pseudomonas sp. p21]
METETATYISFALSAISAIAAAASAFGAFYTIKKTAQNSKLEQEADNQAREDERLMNHAKTTLERAYLALRGPSERAAEPPRDRLNWLTSARLIEEYKATKKRITSDFTMRECESHEEHWRHQFYLLLSPVAKRLGGIEYYRRISDQELGIDPVSAIIVKAFATWPDDKNDPLDKYRSPQDAANKLGVSNIWTSFRFHLKDIKVNLPD